MPTLPEAQGMAEAMADTGLPYIISFTIEAGGTLADGTPIHTAIAAIDRKASPAPLCYMANCVHPSLVRRALSRPWNRTGLVRERFLGLQANASSLSPAELDGAGGLHGSDPEALADEALLRREAGLRVLGGCCGTDDRHMEAVAERLSGGMGGKRADFRFFWQEKRLGTMILHIGRIAFAAQNGLEVFKNPCVIESKFWQGVQRVKGGSCGIVSGPKRFGTFRVRDIDHGHGVPPGIAFRVGVDSKQTFQRDFKAGFLEGLAHGGLFRAFSFLDETAGQGMSAGGPAPFHEDHAPFGIVDDRIHRGGRIAVAFHDGSALGTDQFLPAHGALLVCIREPGLRDGRSVFRGGNARLKNYNPYL